MKYINYLKSVNFMKSSNCLKNKYLSFLAKIRFYVKVNIIKINCPYSRNLGIVQTSVPRVIYWISWHLGVSDFICMLHENTSIVCWFLVSNVYSLYSRNAMLSRKLNVCVVNFLCFRYIFLLSNAFSDWIWFF